jgi:hypothetical protein
VEINRAAGGDFLHALFAGCPDGLFVLVWVLQAKKSHWVPVGRLGQADSLVASAGGRDVYVGVALSPRDYGAWKRCPADEAAGIVGLWADIDIKGPAHKAEDLPQSVKEARELAYSLDLPPSLLVDSGHGLQAWWLLTRPWVFADDGERREAQELARRFCGALQKQASARKWHLDSTGDLARVMRLPGTINAKVAGQPLPVRLLEPKEDASR